METDAACALAALRRDRVLTRSQVRQVEGQLSAGRKQLGEILVAAGWVSPGQWVEALTEAAAPACKPEGSARRPRWVPVPLVIAMLATLGVLWMVSFG
jgi:hypothetical protein